MSLRSIDEVVVYDHSIGKVDVSYFEIVQCVNVGAGSFIKAGEVYSG